MSQITPSLIAALAALVPTVEFQRDWMTDRGGFEPLINDADISQFEPQTVYGTEDTLGRKVFIVRHVDADKGVDSLSVIHQLYTRTAAPVDIMVFHGADEVAHSVLEIDAEIGNVGLDQLGAFFAFYGPEVAAQLIVAELSEQEARQMMVRETARTAVTTATSVTQKAIAMIDSTNAAVATASEINTTATEAVQALEQQGTQTGNESDQTEAVVLGAQQKTNEQMLADKIAKTTAEIAAEAIAQPPAADKGKFVERYTTTDGAKGIRIRANTTGRKIGVGAAVGAVAGLATYGLIRLIRG